MTNLQLRTLSAAVLIPIVFGAIIIGGHTFRNFILVAFCISLFEWIRLSLKTDRKIILSLFGFFYLFICFFEFSYLRRAMDSGLYLVLTMLLIVWAADTGAYFIGSRFGKHKMAPSISPNKSWEGMAGAMVCSAVTLLVLISFAPNLINLVPNTIAIPGVTKSILLLLFGAALGYIGQVGDLIESALKRKAGVKDSSNLIPGHGGVLDRVDSILLIAPFFVLLAIYVL